jgi:hypothetical protein
MQGDARMMPEEIRISEDTSARERLVLMLSTSISALQEQDGSALINSSSQSRHPPPSSELLNDWAALVIESMSVPGRYYHNVDQIFNVAAEMKPKKDAIPILAAIFHDVVYLTIDKQLLEKVKAIVESVIDYKDGDRTQISLLPKDKLVFPLDRMVQRLFSYDPLPRPTRDVNETNEFLSAIVATRLLESYLTKEDLLQIAACIEASIPFRVVDDESFYSPMDSLYQRLKVTASKHCAEATDEFLIQTVQMAAFFANHDLGAFRSKDPMVFLNSSWRLLPEWNPMLLLTDSQQCTLSVMLESLLLMQQRYKQLPVPWIFQSFKDEPSQDVLDE